MVAHVLQESVYTSWFAEDFARVSCLSLILASTNFSLLLVIKRKFYSFMAVVSMINIVNKSIDTVPERCDIVDVPGIYEGLFKAGVDERFSTRPHDDISITRIYSSPHSCSQ